MVGDRAAPETLLFIHGNLACADWFELAAQHLPPWLRVLGIDWRGCGDSDKPAPDADFGNYTVERHADDMLAVLHALEISRCHLATHSTGGIISLHMLLREPGGSARWWGWRRSGHRVCALRMRAMPSSTS